MDHSHLKGLANELLAANHFAEQGYQIYFPLATQSKCDFIIERDSKLQKVQVKTAAWNKPPRSPHKYLQCRLVSRNQQGYKGFYKEGDFDVIVFVSPEKRMWTCYYEDIAGLTSVCLDSDNPYYKVRTDKYNPSSWKVDN